MIHSSTTQLEQNMNTYKIVIEANLNKVSLKDYSVNYVDVQAKNADFAVLNAQKQYGENFVVGLVSAM
jgi:hypothetical protein